MGSFQEKDTLSLSKSPPINFIAQTKFSLYLGTAAHFQSLLCTQIKRDILYIGQGIASV